MGLDSIELVLEIEKYFNIQIPDEEAEKIVTIQLMIDCISEHIHITNNNTELRDAIFEKVKNALEKLGIVSSNILLSDLLSMHIHPNDKMVWQGIENLIFLLVPETNISQKENNYLAKLTFEKFVTAICINNYELLVNQKNIKSTYEIYVAVGGITLNKIGVDIYEIAPEKSFTDDLGVD